MLPNSETKRIRIFTWVYGLILVVTVSLMLISRETCNQTTSVYNNEFLKFQHPWIQTWFYFLAKFLCIIVIFHRDYNHTYGTSPPSTLFPVTSAAFVSGAHHETKDVKNNIKKNKDPIDISRSKKSFKSTSKSSLLPNSRTKTRNAEEDDTNFSKKSWALSWNKKKKNKSTNSSKSKKKFSFSSFDDVACGNNNENDEKFEATNLQPLSHKNNNTLTVPNKIMNVKNDKNDKNSSEKQYVFVKKKSAKKYKSKLIKKKYAIDMRSISRQFTWDIFIKQQIIYFIQSLLFLFAQSFLNLGLFYISGSICQMLLCLLIIYTSIYRCHTISKIYHLVGLIFLFVGVIIIGLATFGEMKDLGWSTVESIFGLSTFCIGCAFLSIYLTIYQYFYEKWNLYWRLCLTLKNQSITISSVQPAQRNNILKLYTKFNKVRLEQEDKLIFIHWNHIKFTYMEGIYGIIFTSLFIVILTYLNNDNGDDNGGKPPNDLTNVLNWFYEDIFHFLKCIKSNNGNIYIVFVLLYIISCIFYEIIIEDSRYHLSPYHSRVIYILSIILIWIINISIHYLASPHVDKDKDGTGYYGEILNLYDLIQLMGLLFLIGGILIHSNRFVVFVNGMIEHNDSIGEQYRLYQLHEYWNNIYIKKEKSRLGGFEPNYLEKEYQSDTEYSIKSINKSMNNMIINRNPANAFLDLSQSMNMDKLDNIITPNDNDNDNDNIKTEQPETFDDGELKGAMSLLLGKETNNSFMNAPTKYYPSFYE